MVFVSLSGGWSSVTSSRLWPMVRTRGVGIVHWHSTIPAHSHTCFISISSKNIYELACVFVYDDDNSSSSYQHHNDKPPLFATSCLLLHNCSIYEWSSRFVALKSSVAEAASPSCNKSTQKNMVGSGKRCISRT